MQFWLGALYLLAGQAMPAIEPAPSLPRDHMEIVNSEYFIAHLLSVTEGVDGKFHVEVKFEPRGPLSQAEAIGIRESCQDSAHIIDGQQQTFRLPYCASAGEAYSANVLWLEDEGTAVVRRYDFAKAGGQASTGPYTIEIPIIYTRTTEEDRPQPQKRLVLAFRTNGGRTSSR